MRTPFTELVGLDHPIVGFNRSPAVVAAVTNAGGLGVLAASAFTASELDAQLTWIEEQVAGKPYGVDLLVPEKFAVGDPDDLIASLRAQIPQAHLDFVADLLDRYGIPAAPAAPARGAVQDEVAAALSPAGHEGALRLESFFIGQVVGSFTEIRPAAEITRQIIAECEERIAELGALL
jgi:NAD(P)H-dependent flavin oxidoreductase YrpB (nitropropane dioxygenase family)